MRHKHGDWGELPKEDVRENEWALQHSARRFSAFKTRTDEKLWLITVWNRSVTTLLLPEEYSPSPLILTALLITFRYNRTIMSRVVPFTLIRREATCGSTNP